MTSNKKQKLGKNVILEFFGEISVGIVDEINANHAPIVHLHWIFKEEWRAKKLGSVGKKSVIDKFSSEKVAQQYYELYQQIIRNGTNESKTD